MSTLTHWLDLFYELLWGNTMIYAILLTGILLSIGTRFIQYRKLGSGFKLMLSKNINGSGDITPFEALMTSLAAMVGTGDITGVALAIISGGPGAIFWMWVTAIFGGAIHYSEAVLSVRYRVRNSAGEMSGGPMYYITHGMKESFGGDWKWLGSIYAICGVVASFGLGNMVQANSVAQSIKASLGFSPIITGFLITFSASLAILGGIKIISKVASAMVPFMLFIFLSGSFIILITHFTKIPGAFAMIFDNAFTGQAVMGGMLGTVIKQGISRGLFANEAGIGSASIVHAAAKTERPVEQGMIAMTATTIDTLIVCTTTALVILISGYIQLDANGFMTVAPNIDSASIAIKAYELGFPFILGPVVISFSLITFAFSTILGWYYYGAKCLEFIAGEKAIHVYSYVYLGAILFGSMASLSLVWKIADILNALMAVPNLIVLVALSPLIFHLTREYEQKGRTDRV